jgi:tRNA (pseudouridine54-N1)-methyltransferase
MRIFAVIAHKFRGEINLNDLPGSGRIDVIARCINSAIFLSHNIRRDVLFFTYFPLINSRIKIDSSKVKYLNPDERSTAALIRNAVINLGDDEIRSSPGFYVKRESFEDFLDEIKNFAPVYYLHEDGEDIREVKFQENSAFILSDSLNLSAQEDEEVIKYAKEKISVGPKSILASHAITIVHNELDRRGL